MRLGILPVLLCALTLVGCASTPDVTVNYILPHGTLDTTVTRLVTCDASNDPIMTTTVTPKPNYTASTILTDRISFELHSLDHFYADSDTAFTTTEDGRLVSINQNTTGQGSAIVKSVVALGLAVAALDSSADAQKVRAGACSWLNTTTANKGLTVNYFVSEDFSGDVTLKAIPPTADSHDAESTLNPLIGDICMTATLIDDPNDPKHRRVTYEAGTSDDVVLVKVRQPAGYQVSIFQQGSGGERCKSQIWTGVVYVPQRGHDLDLPVPRAALFGNQAFKLTLSDSGQITSIEYSHTSGTSAAADSGQAVAAALKRQTPTDVAADLKAQADEIAQRARLLKCQQDPTGCT